MIKLRPFFFKKKIIGGFSIFKNLPSKNTILTFAFLICFVPSSLSVLIKSYQELHIL